MRPIANVASIFSLFPQTQSVLETVDTGIVDVTHPHLQDYMQTMPSVLSVLYQVANVVHPLSTLLQSIQVVHQAGEQVCNW